jgi:hypothetical protein
MHEEKPSFTIEKDKIGLGNNCAMAGRSTKGRDRLRQRTCEVLCRCCGRLLRLHPLNAGQPLPFPASGALFMAPAVSSFRIPAMPPGEPLGRILVNPVLRLVLRSKPRPRN